MRPHVTLVWDASALHHSLRADRADVLGDIAGGGHANARRSVSTRAVFEELSAYGLDTASLTWLEPQPLDGLTELRAFIRWQELVGAGKRHMGEATVLAWSEVHSATAIIDDNGARLVGQGNGLEVHGTLWLVADAVRDGRLSATSAGCFVDALIGAGAYYPCRRGDFIEWAKRKSLLP